ncbi:MAG: hypothetical protein RLP02_28005 [Coleofasciculus sp. C2-GNP5-27]
MGIAILAILEKQATSYVNPPHPDCTMKQFFPPNSSPATQEKAAELLAQEAQPLHKTYSKLVEPSPI